MQLSPQLHLRKRVSITAMDEFRKYLPPDTGASIIRAPVSMILFATCRSMPTSAALDVVAKHLNLKFFEVFFFDEFPPLLLIFKLLGM